MKRLIFFTGLLLIIWSCSTKKGVVRVEKNSDSVAQTDSVEYDMETFDSKFETWYSIHNKPALYRSKEFYQHWNRQYVNAWNNQSSGRRNTFFEPIVGYDFTADYGLELNHKLFYYFQYVENVLKIKIMEGAPKAVPFQP